jgi:hypothetical protein
VRTSVQTGEKKPFSTVELHLRCPTITRFNGFRQPFTLFFSWTFLESQSVLAAIGEISTGPVANSDI